MKFDTFKEKGVDYQYRYGGKNAPVTDPDTLFRRWRVGKMLSYKGWRYVQKMVGEAITAEATRLIKDGAKLTNYLRNVSIVVHEDAQSAMLTVKGFKAVKEEIGWSPVADGLEAGLGVEPTGGPMDMRPLLLAKAKQSGPNGRYARVPIEVEGRYNQVIGEMRHGLDELMSKGDISLRTVQRRAKKGRELVQAHMAARYRSLEFLGRKAKDSLKSHAWNESDTLSKKGKQLFKVGENAATGHPYSTFIYSMLSKRMWKKDGKWKSMLNTVRTVNEDSTDGRWYTMGVEAKDIFTSDAIQDAVTKAVTEALTM